MQEAEAATQGDGHGDGDAVAMKEITARRKRARKALRSSKRPIIEAKRKLKRLKRDISAHLEHDRGVEMAWTLLLKMARAGGSCAIAVITCPTLCGWLETIARGEVADELGETVCGWLRRRYGLPAKRKLSLEIVSDAKHGTWLGEGDMEYEISDWSVEDPREDGGTCADAVNPVGSEHGGEVVDRDLMMQEELGDMLFGDLDLEEAEECDADNGYVRYEWTVSIDAYVLDPLHG